MLEIQLRSRLTTSETHSRHRRSVHIEFRDCMPRRRRRADTRIGTAPNQTNEQTRGRFSLVFAPHVWSAVLPSKIALPRPSTMRTASARVELLCVHFVGTLRGVRIRFERFRCVFAWFLTVFKVLGCIFKVCRRPAPPIA